MRILQVIPYLNPKRGGPVTVLHDLTKALLAKGHEVTIATTNFELDNMPSCFEEIRVIVFPCMANLGMILYSPSMIKWINDNISSFDIVHLHEFRSYQNILILKHFQKKGIPYVLQAHGSAAIIERKKSIKKIYDIIWGKKIIKNASACIAVSPLEIPDYLYLGASKNKIVTIPNGLSQALFSDRADSHGEFRKRLGVGEDAEIILYLGRLNERKGIDTLIQAFTQIHINRKNTVLAIVGSDDGYQQQLEKMASNSGSKEAIYFTGFVQNREYAFRDACVLVYPSRHEIFGLVPFEAILCGTPVIVSSDSGCGLIVKQANCGLTVPPGDSEALAAAINDLLNSQCGSQIMIENGINYISNYLNWDKLIKDFEIVYRKAIEES